MKLKDLASFLLTTEFPGEETPVWEMLAIMEKISQEDIMMVRLTLI
jgi:hypothetical protein